MGGKTEALDTSTGIRSTLIKVLRLLATEYKMCIINYKYKENIINTFNVDKKISVFRGCYKLWALVLHQSNFCWLTKNLYLSLPEW